MLKTNFSTTFKKIKIVQSSLLSLLAYRLAITYRSAILTINEFTSIYKLTLESNSIRFVDSLTHLQTINNISMFDMQLNLCCIISKEISCLFQWIAIHFLYKLKRRNDGRLVIWSKQQM